MKKNNITIVIILAAAAIGYYLWTKRRKSGSLAAAAGTAAANTIVTAATQTAGQIGIVPPNMQTGGAGVIDHDFTETEKNSLLSINKPNSSLETKALQIYLNEMGSSLNVDGSFGPATENALNTKIGKKSVTLKELKITRIFISNNESYVFGTNAFFGTGRWNGTIFVGNFS
jgi:hypothetical protein